jgi:VanZ family protein
MLKVTKHSLVPEASKKNQIKYYTPAIFWGVLILYFSLLPHHRVPNALVTINDLLMHAGIYALFTFFIVAGRFFQTNRTSPGWRYGNFVALVATILGGCIELIQEQFVSGRTGEWADFWANAFGAFLGMVIAIYVVKLWPRANS